MIGVICRPNQELLAEELFQLFKVPWCLGLPAEGARVLLVTDPGVSPSRLDADLIVRVGASAREAGAAARFARDGFHLPIYGELHTVDDPGTPIGLSDTGRPVAVRQEMDGRTTIVLGYDLLEQLRHLIGVGQPEEWAAVPTLDFHLELLRRWILNAGIPLVELLPTPWGSRYVVCLTHDIDFFEIRRHRLDRTILGFAYRASVGTVRDVARRRRSWGQLRRNLRALALLPLVHLGIARDFWQPFLDYAEADHGLPSTYFVIPFRNQPGEHVGGKRRGLRATRYDVRDVADHVRAVERAGCEVAVHGIDAWHDAAAGSSELDAVARVVGREDLGVRMHWLCWMEQTPERLGEAGFRWDATFGYNGRVGFRAGTTQIYSPSDSGELLEVPLHVQDTALFLPRRLNLTESEAERVCTQIRAHAALHGGVLVVSWHDRSLAPERLWDGFYRRLLGDLRRDGARFATVSAAASWARTRRATRICTAAVNGTSARIRFDPPPQGVSTALTLRVSVARTDGTITHLDAPWGGERDFELDVSRLADSVGGRDPSHAGR